MATIDWVYTGGSEAEITAAVAPMLASPFLIDGSQSQAVHETLAAYSINAYNTAGLWMRRFVINSLVLPDQVLPACLIRYRLPNRLPILIRQQLPTASGYTSHANPLGTRNPCLLPGALQPPPPSFPPTHHLQDTLNGLTAVTLSNPSIPLW